MDHAILNKKNNRSFDFKNIRHKKKLDQSN